MSLSKEQNRNGGTLWSTMILYMILYSF